MTPNDDACYIEVDGERHSWRDGQGVIFDETYLHEAHNRTDKNRIILFCDIERPLRSRIATAINRWFSRHVMSAASSPNDANDKVGAINRLTRLHFLADQKRKQFKGWSPLAYKLTKVVLLAAAVADRVSAVEGRCVQARVGRGGWRTVMPHTRGLFRHLSHGCPALSFSRSPPNGLSLRCPPSFDF